MSEACNVHVPPLTKPLHHSHWTASYLILCVKMRERILIGSHKKLKESERKGNLEYIFGRMSIRTGDTDREEMIKGEMKEP